MLGPEFFSQPLLDCARALVGTELHWHGCSGLVVETEAYGAVGDEACHAFLRTAARQFIAEEAPGTAYVYKSYGMHWMLNVQVKGGGHDGLILIRAAEPRAGVPLMQARRGVLPMRLLLSGPGKLAQAMAITSQHHKLDLCHTPDVGFAPRAEPVEPTADIRVGLTRAVDFPWRFLMPDSPWVSVKQGKVRPIVRKPRRPIQPPAA